MHSTPNWRIMEQTWIWEHCATCQIGWMCRKCSLTTGCFEGIVASQVPRSNILDLLWGFLEDCLY